MRALIVTRDTSTLDALRELIEGEGHEALHSEKVTGVLDAIERAEVDLVITEPELPDGDGLSLLEELKRVHPEKFGAVLTDGAMLSPAAAMARGAGDVLSKPVDKRDVAALLRRIETSGGGADDSAQGTNGNDAENGRGDFRGMYGATAIMRDVFRMIARVGRTDVTVLVTGESGTGKELVARALHEESARRSKPFIALNCSALPSELVESELFGHTRGAFTGAVKDRGGLFEAANGGTLFLDEIGDLGPLAQAKVLRALENGEVMRVGGTRSTRVNVRVIAATNRPLDEMVIDGRFREDLLYRLKVITLKLPPLRERKEDIPLLSNHFLQLFASRHGLSSRGIDDEAMAALIAYDWPGNVRELRNVIEGALVMADGPMISLRDLPPHLRRPEGKAATDTPSRPILVIDDAADLPFVEARERALREFDRAFLSAALARNGGNIARTARALGLHRQSLQKLLARRDMRQNGDLHSDK